MKAPVPFEVFDGFLHGTRVVLKFGDLIEPGRASNYGKGERAQFAYATSTLDAATWGAELATGDGCGHIYLVEPLGPLEDDPNVTNARFPVNPTRSFRTRAALRVVGELLDWVGHSPEQVKTMKDGLAKLAAQGVEAINE